MAKKTKSKDGGYVPFSKEDINLDDNRNTRAEELFLQMLDIPKRIIKKKKKGKEESITDDDFYPTSMDEIVRMEAMMEQVEAAIDDRSDSEFMEHVSFMKDVLAWSKKRHWKFAWWIIGCVFVVSMYYFYSAGGEVENGERIMNWSEQTAQEKYDYMISMAEEGVKVNEQSLANATNKDDIKTYEGFLKSAKEHLAESRKMTPQDYKESLAKGASSQAWPDRISAIWCLIWIVLYIFAERPYGYMISKRRTELAVYGGMRKVLFGIAGAFVGAAGALQVTEYVTTYTDGSKKTDSDAFAVYAMKLGLLAAAALLVLFVARVVIVIATIMGFIRNYDLVALVKQAINKGKELRTKQSA